MTKSPIKAMMSRRLRMRHSSDDMASTSSRALELELDESEGSFRSHHVVYQEDTLILLECKMRLLDILFIVCDMNIDLKISEALSSLKIAVDSSILSNGDISRRISCCKCYDSGIIGYNNTCYRSLQNGIHFTVICSSILISIIW